MNLPARASSIVATLFVVLAGASIAHAEAFEPEVDPSFVRSGAFPAFAATLADGTRIDAVRSIDVDGDGDVDRLLDVVSEELGEDACILARATPAGWTSVVLDRGATGEYLDVHCGEPVTAGGRVYLTTSGYGRELDVRPIVTYNRYQVITADRAGALWLVHEGTTRGVFRTWHIRPRQDGSLALVEHHEVDVRGLAVMRTVRHRTIRWDAATTAASLSRWSRGEPRQRSSK